MSFRQYGGMNYAAKNNVIKNNYSNVNNLSVMTKVGQPNTYINFESDISGNLRVSGDFDLSGNLYVSGDIDCSGNMNIDGDIDCSGNLIIHGDFDLSGDLIVDNSIYANEMYLTGPVVDVPNSVVPKSYVDAISTGIYPTLPCKCATTAPITLSGIQTIDGYIVSAGDRVLVNNQNGTNSSIANGIYDVSSGLWSRASDCSGNNVRGQATFVQFGNTNQRSTFVQTATGTSPAIAGVDALLYQKYNTINLSLGQGLQFVDSNTIQVKSDLSNNPFITGLAVGNAVGSGPYNAGIFYETSTNNQIFVMPLSGLSSYNPINQTGDSGIVGRRVNGKNQQTLTMSIWSDTPNGLRISPQSLVLGYGGESGISTPISRITFDSSNCFIDSSKCTIDSSNCVINGPLNANNGNVSLATVSGNVYIGNQASTNIYSYNLQYNQYNSRLGLAILAEKYPNSQANYLTLAPYNNNYSFIQSWRYIDPSNNPVYPLLLNPNGGTVAINKVVSGTTFTYALDVGGSVNVSGNLNVDTNTLYVNASTNRVGIGTTNPNFTLDISGNLNVTSDASMNSLTVGRGGGGRNDISCVAFGYEALPVQSTARFNIAIGYQSSYIGTGQGNVAVGFQSLFSNSTGKYNTAVGYFSGGNGNYSYSTAIGYDANITGNNQIVLGTDSETLYIKGGLTYMCEEITVANTTLTFPLKQYYFVSTLNGTTNITLPLLDNTKNGITVTFRRYSINSADINIKVSGTNLIVSHNSIGGGTQMNLGTNVFGVTYTSLNSYWYTTVWLT